MVAIAEAEAGRQAEALDAATQASNLVDWGKLDLRSDKVFGTDLAFLEGELRARGLIVVRPKWFEADQLLEAAVESGTSHPFARAHALRSLATARLESGDVRGSLDALSRAMAIELRGENPAGLDATLVVAADVAARLGVPEVRAWNSGTDLELDDQVLPGTPDFASAARLRATDHGRRKLAQMIEAYRRSPDARLRPDRDLLEVLLEPSTLRYSKGRSWEFTMHAGLLLRDVGAFDASRDYLESSVSTIESTRMTIPDATLRQRFFSDKRTAYESLVEHYVGIATSDRPITDIRRAFSVANATKARGLLDLLDGAIDPELTIGTMARWEPSSDLRSRAETLQARMRTWMHRPLDRTHATSFDGLDAFAAAGGGVRYVEYLIGERVGFVFVIGGETLEVRKIAGRVELEERVSRHQQLVMNPSADDAELRASAERLYVDLVAPIQDLVVDANQLIIAPDRAISGVEFAALARPTKRSRARWLVRDHAISYVPSTAVAQRMAARPRGPARGSLLLGDPDLDRPGLALAALTSQAETVAFERLADRFEPLPGARKEVSTIAGYTPAPRRIRRGNRATESLILRPSVLPLEVLHIAAHGVSDHGGGLDVEQPAVLLAKADGAPRDGILTLEEILVRKPRARLVTLSGCETGVGWQSLGYGAFGLAGGFLYAGSEVVVASSWRVEDDATGRLMKRFYSNRTAGAAEALRRAQIAESKRLPPFYWASFRVFGDLPKSSASDRSTE